MAGGVTTARGTILKGHSTRMVENHWPRGFLDEIPENTHFFISNMQKEKASI